MNRAGATIDFHELRQYVIDQKLLTFEMVGFLKDFISKIGIEILNKAKQKTPVDTGALKASWGMRTDKISQRAVYLYSRYANKWVEKTLYTYEGQKIFKGKGTGSIDSLYDGGNSIGVVLMNPQEYASQIEDGFFTSSGWYPGKHMLRRSINEVIPRIQSYYNANFEIFKARMGL